MTAAELLDWQRRCGLARDRDAAAALGISISTYRRKRTGRTRITRQTELLAMHYEVLRINWLSIAELSTKLARLMPSRL